MRAQGAPDDKGRAMAEAEAVPEARGAAARGPWRISAAALAYIVVLAVVFAELVAISLVYSFDFVHYECVKHTEGVICRLTRTASVRALSVIVALMLFAIARPAVFAPLFEARPGLARPAYARPAWAAAQLLGALMFAAPPFFFDAWTSAPVLALTHFAWALGAALAIAGALFTLHSPSEILETARRGGWTMLIVAVSAYALYDVAELVSRIWALDAITEGTFNSVASMIQALGYDVLVDPATKYIRVGDFAVIIERPCSGVEGLGLMTGFMLIYIGLFRDQLHFPRIWILLPIALMLSWIFNAVRVTVLVLIGVHVSPDLAVNGFHSYAGWLMFTILAVSLAMVAHHMAWFHAAPASAAAGPSAAAAAAPRRAPPPFLDDPNAAMIAPFIVFMASSLVLSTFSETPSLYYPARFALMLGALLLFWRFLRGLDWRFDPLSLGAGALVGVAWLATAGPAEEGDAALMAALGEAGAVYFVLWAICRALGSSVLVPVIEELFFRGYVMRRVAQIGAGGPWMIALGVVVSAALFAALHDRWLAAGLAGVLFGLLALRSGRVADAILAHAIANAIISGWAVATGQWSVI